MLKETSLKRRSLRVVLKISKVEMKLSTRAIAAKKLHILNKKRKKIKN